MRSWVIKIRSAQTAKIPYQIVIGDRKLSEGTVNVRHYGSAKSEATAMTTLSTSKVGHVANKSRLNYWVLNKLEKG